jgi:hypothetical protein
MVFGFISIFALKNTKMKENRIVKSLVIACLAFFCLTSCCHKDPMNMKLWGHWGCERYISCRTYDDGTEKWDSLYYIVGAGHGYEFWFNEDGSGKFRMNDSPALIKQIDITYELYEEQQEIAIHGSKLFYLLYGSQYFDENEARFHIQTLNDSVLHVDWTNVVSENKPFYEDFYLRKITD